MPIKNELKTLNKRYRNAERHFLGNRIEAALAEIRIIEALEKILQHKTKRTKRLAAMGFVLFSMMVISLGLTIRLPTTEVDLTIKTSGMELISTSKSTSVLANTVIESAGISIDNVEYFNSIPPQLYKKFKQFAQQPATGDISVEAKSTILEEFSLEPSGKNTTIVIDHGHGNVDLFVRNSRLSGLLAIKEPRHVVTSVSHDKGALFADDTPNDRHYRHFSTAEYSDGAVPHSIRFFEVSKISAQVVDLRTVRFAREYPPGSGQAQSTIVGGTVRLLEIGEEISVESGDYLSVECKDCTRNTINHGADHVSLTLRGTITRLAGGHERDLKNYMPTLLAYLYYNEKIAMVWTATLFILGLFWNVRNYI